MQQIPHYLGLGTPDTIQLDTNNQCFTALMRLLELACRLSQHSVNRQLGPAAFLMWSKLERLTTESLIALFRE